MPVNGAAEAARPTLQKYIFFSRNIQFVYVKFTFLRKGLIHRALQKATFYMVKGGLSARNSRPFGMRKAVY